MKHREKPIRRGNGAGARPWETGASPRLRKVGRPKGEQEALDVDFCLNHCPYYWEDGCRHMLRDCKKLAEEANRSKAQHSGFASERRNGGAGVEFSPKGEMERAEPIPTREA